MGPIDPAQADHGADRGAAGRAGATRPLGTGSLAPTALPREGGQANEIKDPGMGRVGGGGPP